MSHLRIFLVLLGIVARLASAVDFLTLCSGKLSGTLLPNPHDCGSYYVCQSGPQLAYCGEGLHFDRVHKVCNWPETANCRISVVEKEQPSRLAETLKGKSTQDASNEVKPSSPASEFTEEESNERIVEARKPSSVSSQDESNEKFVKDESNEAAAQASNPVSELAQDESNEKIVEPNSIDVELKEAVEEDSSQNEELVEELVDAIKSEEEKVSNARPIQLPLAKLPGLDVPDNNMIQPHGLESLIPSSLPNHPSSAESAEKEVASIENEESEETPTHAIQVPIVVHGDRPDFLTSNSSKPLPGSADLPNPIIAVQVPISVVRPSPVQLTVEKEELLEPPKESANLNHAALETSLSEEEIAAPENVRPTIELHMPVKGGKNPIVNGPNVSEHVEENSDGHIIAVNVPVHNFEITTSIVNGSSSNDEEHAGLSKPPHYASHVIQVHVPVHHSEVANSIDGGDAQAVASHTPSRNVTHVIEVHVPVHPIEVGDFIVNTDNSSGQAEQLADKVGATEGEQVIEQREPVFPVDATNSIELSDTIVEKVGSANELNHVIELQAPAYAADISNAIGDAINAIPKVDSTQSSGSSGPVHELPADISNAFLSAVVERVDSGKPTTGSGQVIDLPAQALPDFVSNAIVHAVNALQPADVVVERVESAKPSESSGQPNPLQYSNVIANTGNGIPQGEVLVEKVESLNPPNQPAVNFAENPALAFHESAAEKYDRVPQTSESLESSVQSSKESSSSELSDSSEDDKTLHLSSEEFDQDVKEAEDNFDSTSMEDYQTVPETGQSSEEKIVQIAEGNFGSQSAESHEKDSGAQQNLANVDTQSSEEDLTFAAAHESFAGELHHKNEASNEKSPITVEEDNQITDSVSFFENISKKPNYRPAQQRPMSDVVKDKRPAKRPSMHRPKPGGDRYVPGQSHSPTTSPINVNTSHHQWNLTEVILSVGANTSTNDTIIRPSDVGAHDINTGDPIDVMIDYNSNYVQCIHNGLYFLPHPSNCQKYFICAYRHLHLHSCGDNLIWSYKRERCELEIDSRCFSNETPIANPMPQKTTKPEGENIYNGTTAATNGVRPSTPMPPLRTTNPSTLAETPPILDEELPNCPSLQQAYLPSYDNCNKYYICILGHAVLTSCPDKLHWDAIGEFCGRSTKVRCASRVQMVSTYEQ